MPTKEQKKRKIRRRKSSGAIRVIAAAIILAVLALGAWLVWENRPQSTVMTYPVEYVDLIRRYSEENGVNPAYTAAVILAESSYRPEAVSSVNAQGLMQILPSTGEWLAGKYDEAYVEGCLFDPETNIRYGCWYLGFLMRRYDGNMQWPPRPIIRDRARWTSGWKIPNTARTERR
ncbi:MAG: lytic transglycosylase domain-containing protein [Clostridia bacterium]|nr:lytic transglycosylase domain-containing protein [Clostridia bacterium]